MRAATPSCLSPFSSAYSLVGAHVPRQRDERLLVGVAVRDQLAVRREHHGVPVRADPDAVDGPPHLLEAELADEPA
jgi:hypothetical protein